jgi:DNA repair protein RadC
MCVKITVFTGKGHRENLRNRFRRTGAAGFAEHELLEMLLTYSIPRKDVKPIAKAMLSRKKSTYQLLNSDMDTLKDIDGVGPESLFFLKFISDFIKDYLSAAVPPQESNELYYAKKLYKVLHERMMHKEFEFYEIVYLKSDFSFSDDNIDQIEVSTLANMQKKFRHILRKVIYGNYSAIILCKNNPNSSNEMNQNDENLAEHLGALLNIVSAEILDFIFADGNFIYSSKSGDKFQVIGEKCIKIDDALESLVKK